MGIPFLKVKLEGPKAKLRQNVFFGITPNFCTECQGSKSEKCLWSRIGSMFHGPSNWLVLDGYCNTDEYDIGIHTVCGTMTEEFLEYTKNQGNDLSTPRGSFPGLKPGNRWALCAPRWLEAYRAGKAPLVRLNATNIKSLQV